MGLLNRIFAGADFSSPVGPTAKARKTRNGSPPLPADVQPAVGKIGKRSQFFADFSRPYYIPDGRASAGFTAASNGGGLNTPATYLNGRKVKDRLDLDLGTVRTDFAINISGSVVVYADSTLGTDRIQVRFATSDGDQAGPLVPFRPGQFIGGERYSRLLITNTAQAGSTATLIIVEDRPGDEFSYR